MNYDSKMVTKGILLICTLIKFCERQRKLVKFDTLEGYKQKGPTLLRIAALRSEFIWLWRFTLEHVKNQGTIGNLILRLIYLVDIYSAERS